MKVMIAAGGTGGHFYPGLAVARELANAGVNVSFLIKKGDYVRPFLEREKIPFVAIAAGGFDRRMDPRNALVVGKLFFGFFEALRFLSSNRPDVLLVMGGYLSVPPALAARLLGIPVLLHEQNVIPGLANRFLSRVASKVAVSFEASLTLFPKKVVLTGNPVRREFTQMPSQQEARKKWKLDPNKHTIFIFGGSLGAHRLNELIVESLGRLQQHAKSFQFLHITGMADVNWVRQRYEQMAFTRYVDSYCHDMPAAYAASDLVIGRAGASTVSELLVVKKPAFLIPYPLATGGHQTANAEVLSKLGAVHIYQQKDLERGQLKDILDLAMRDLSMWQAWAENYSRSKINPAEATEKIVGLIREIAA